MLRILFCHNYYQQVGGEDICYDDEVELFRARGHKVSTYTLHNDRISEMSPLSTAVKTLWNQQTYRELLDKIKLERPDVMHCTNSFPLMSPSVYYAAKSEGIAVVQALRNFRLICPGALLFRDGKICEACLGDAIPWRAARYQCYRKDLAASSVVTTMLSIHNVLRTWHRKIDYFFCPSQFTRRKFIDAGYPQDRLLTIPNFVSSDSGVGAGKGKYAVFVGRLSPEKDLHTLLTAWSELAETIPLKIIGDGPQASLVESAQRAGTVEWLGYRPKDEVLSIIGDAAFLVMPSVWYETFGRVIVEAFLKGTPVIVSNVGAMAELVENGRTGLWFNAGDAADLALKVRHLLSDTRRLAQMRVEARAEFERKYTAEHNYQMLLSMYDQAMETVNRQARDVD